MVEIKNVCVKYEDNYEIFKQLSLNVEKGEFVFVTGPSGSGKSTLVKLLTREILPTRGTVTVNGTTVNGVDDKKLYKYRKTIGIVFQDFRLIDSKNVYENLYTIMRGLGMSKTQTNARIPALLKQVGMEGMEGLMPHQLSGGEQQRLSIARAMCADPKLIIADEPTGNLDPEMSGDIMRLLADINAKGTTVIVVTHEKALVNEFDKRVIRLERGEIVSDKQGGYTNA